MPRQNRSLKFTAIVGLAVFLKTMVFLAAFLTQNSFAGGRSEIQQLYNHMSHYADLPECCQVRLTEREFVNRKKPLPEKLAVYRERWVKKIGARNWVTFHHYCWGIKNFKKAQSITGVNDNEKAERESALKTASNEFLFVKKSIDPSFPFLRQLLFYEYSIYTRLGQWEKSMAIMHQIKKFQQQGGGRQGTE